MNKIIKMTIALCAAALAVCFVSAKPVKAMTAEEQFLLTQMQLQQDVINAAKQYFDYQVEVSKAEQRKISDIEMVKRQALEGAVAGDYRLLGMGYQALALGYPPGEANIAYMDKEAYDGLISGLKYLEDIKQKTWMTYTWRTH